jgi:hypothetical protein
MIHADPDAIVDDREITTVESLLKSPPHRFLVLLDGHPYASSVTE